MEAPDNPESAHRHPGRTSPGICCAEAAPGDWPNYGRSPGGAIPTRRVRVHRRNPDAHVRAFDIDSGKQLWKYKQPAGSKATPMTYPGTGGRRYRLISAGGGKSWGQAGSVMAFTLPKTP